MKNLITLFLLLISTISLSQESTFLRFNYNTEDKYLMNMVMTQDMGDTMKMDTEIEIQTEIKAVTDSIFSSEMSFKRIKMDMSQGGINVSFDSDIKVEDLDDSGKMMSEQMKPILETVLASKTNTYGKILEMKMIKGDAANADQFTNQMQSVTYPKEPVKVGYSWTDEKENNGMVISSTYTVKSINTKSVIIDIDGNISGAASGTLTGNMNIDKLTGVSSLSTINMEMEIMGQKMMSEIIVSMIKVE